MKHSEVRQIAFDYVEKNYGERVKILTPEDYPHYIVDYGRGASTKYDIIKPEVNKWSDRSPRAEDYSVTNYSTASIWIEGKDFNKADYKPVMVNYLNVYLSTKVGIRIEFVIKFREGDTMENTRRVLVPESYRDFVSSDTTDTFDDLFNQL